MAFFDLTELSTTLGMTGPRGCAARTAPGERHWPAPHGLPPLPGLRSTQPGADPPRGAGGVEGAGEDTARRALSPTAGSCSVPAGG